MESDKKSKKRGNSAAIFVISAILFTNLTIAAPRYMFYVYIILFFSMIYTLLLILKKPDIIKRMFSSYSFIWIFFFAIEMFIYGYF